ncbi:hypothetical protein [Chryseobacterium sp. A321]
MKWVSLHILSLLIFAASFQNSLLLVDYQVNRSFYELHCMNQDRPELECHGKCELTKASENSNSLFRLVQIGFEFHILPSESTIDLSPPSKFRQTLEKIGYSPSLFSNPLFSVRTAPPQF